MPVTLGGKHPSFKFIEVAVGKRIVNWIYDSEFGTLSTKLLTECHHNYIEVELFFYVLSVKKGFLR